MMSQACAHQRDSSNGRYPVAFRPIGRLGYTDLSPSYHYETPAEVSPRDDDSLHTFVSREAFSAG